VTCRRAQTDGHYICESYIITIFNVKNNCTRVHRNKTENNATVKTNFTPPSLRTYTSLRLPHNVGNFMTDYNILGTAH